GRVPAPGGGSWVDRLLPRLHLEAVDGQGREHRVLREGGRSTPRGPVDGDLAQPGVASHVDPAMATFVHERVESLLQEIVDERGVGARGRDGGRVQAAGRLTNKVQVT